MTPLITASVQGHTEVVLWLLQNNANPNSTNDVSCINNIVVMYEYIEHVHVLCKHTLVSSINVIVYVIFCFVSNVLNKLTLLYVYEQKRYFI